MCKCVLTIYNLNLPLLLFIDNGDVPHCEAEGLQYGDIMPSQRHQRLLMLSSYNQAYSFCIWKTSPSLQE